MTGIQHKHEAAERAGWSLGPYDRLGKIILLEFIQ